MVRWVLGKQDIPILWGRYEIQSFEAGLLLSVLVNRRFSSLDR